MQHCRGQVCALPGAWIPTEQEPRPKRSWLLGSAPASYKHKPKSINSTDYSSTHTLLMM